MGAPEEIQSAAAVVLCGGQSSRMGYAKADLPFGRESMLSRVIDRLHQVGLKQILLAASADQVLPEDTPSTAIVIRDETPRQGPMEALRGALRAAEAFAEVAFVTGCDAPFLAPKLVQHLLQMLDDHEIVAASDAQFLHPLTAVYRTRLADRIDELIAAGKMRPRTLIEDSDCVRIDVEQLRPFDPHLESFTNMNRPEDYFQALASAGLTPPEDIVRHLKDDSQDSSE